MYEAQTARMEKLKQQQIQLDQEREDVFSSQLLEQQKSVIPATFSYLYEFLHQDQK